MKVKRENEVAQLCLTIRDPMHCSLPGSSAHGIFQARVLESVAIAFSLVVKNLPANAADAGSIPGLGRPLRVGKGNPLQYSCLENLMDREPGELQAMGSQRSGHY